MSTFLASSKPNSKKFAHGQLAEIKHKSCVLLHSSVDIQEEIECLYNFVPEVEQHFDVFDKIGEGTFSSVFLARLKQYPDVDHLFALKHIIPTSHPSRIEGELRCLLEIGGCDNVMGVELCLRNRDHVVIVMQYFPHEEFQDYILTMSLMDVHDYMKNLLIALRRVHKFNVIHRDVKPSNFLCNRKTKRYALVDFGLAHKGLMCKTTEEKTADIFPDASIIKKHILSNRQINPDAQKSVNKQENNTTSSGQKLRQYTPPTLNLVGSVFTKHVKSPRRMLLAKRALMTHEKQDSILSRNKSSSRHYQGEGRHHQGEACQCFGKPQICSMCTARSNQNAPRAGTPGFRSPEVLIKCPDQSTAVDIWSAGVIFLSLLSGRYPFFRAKDDLTALAQIISTFGSEAMTKAAKDCGKNLVCSPHQNKVELRMLCNKLRFVPLNKPSSKTCKASPEAEQSWHHVPESAYDLLARLLDLNPFTRITAEQALEHPFFKEMDSKL